MNYPGACHCGAISILLQSAKTPSTLGARQCSCDFCRVQAAAWTSDPEGRLEISAHGPISRYQFGTKTADFIVCGQCGMAPAVIAVMGDKILGVVRVNCLQDRDEFMKASLVSDLGDEAVQTRLDRRSCNWTPATISEMAKHA